MDLFIFDYEVLIDWNVCHFLWKVEYQRRLWGLFFSPLLSDDVNPSDLSSLSDSLTLDDGKC